MALQHRTWNFNIDRYLNPFVPSPPWRHLPYQVARFFGYRRAKPAETGNLMPVFWAFIGIFAAILLIQGVSQNVPSFESKGAPMIVGSFGAAAVLEFYSIEAPLAQPRNAIFGQLVSVITGVAVAKLFQLSDRFDDIQWVGGALACASATALMALTKTVHPPAGATALLAVVDNTLVKIGWFLIPVVLLGCALMLSVALLVNNIERRFPIYWWTPEDLSKREPIVRTRRWDKMSKQGLDEEKMAETWVPETSAACSQSTARDGEGHHEANGKDDAKSSGLRLTRASHSLGEIVIRKGEVVIPEHLFLTQEEQQLLETISSRL
ncbi:hypothetical protein QQS21_001213 [Conoideocrella luteorostrata]|uniref:HPP transmembrane region domain-containing protein n=1 Tax=Conoideocrella luteorostrata TaxID=1105319 RepID=A0AAJ0FXR2_9HYPO|nr:hypothetical protein QQS21_001213 [Conoideocrella luteorostrata]